MPGKAGHNADSRKPEDLPDMEQLKVVGRYDGVEIMTTLTQSKAQTSTAILAIAVCAFIGLAIISVAGHVQASAVHDAAHDTRHATGFPCH